MGSVEMPDCNQKISDLKIRIGASAYRLIRYEQFIWNRARVEYVILGYFGFGALIRYLLSMTTTISSWFGWALTGVGFVLLYSIFNVLVRWAMSRSDIKTLKTSLRDDLLELKKLENDNA